MPLLIELTSIRVLQVDAVSFVLYKNPKSLSALISHSLSKLELKELLCPHHHLPLPLFCSAPSTL